MEIPVASIKELRCMSSASIADCKKALQEASGDLKKAMSILRKKGLETAAKKKDRAAKEGRIEAYVHHGNKLGVLLEVDCETDFVAKNEEFCHFTKDVAMQIAACNPVYVSKEDVPADVLKEEKDQDSFFAAHCLLEQPFIKDASLTIKDCLGSLVAKFNENIVVRKFIRFKIGE